ncbi:hypothetical protein [Streptomyces broussonetiae]|uniref:Uncharacterized protein n=1 Tax=Streptomyces broussonetiae TaxID=2686304 RepID=A0ABV5EI69_9ACTN
MAACAVNRAWETPGLRAQLTDWPTTQGGYTAAVLRQHAEPAARGKDVAAVRAALLAARAARVACTRR